MANAADAVVSGVDNIETALRRADDLQGRRQLRCRRRTAVTAEGIQGLERVTREGADNPIRTDPPYPLIPWIAPLRNVQEPAGTDGDTVNQRNLRLRREPAVANVLDDVEPRPGNCLNDAVRCDAADAMIV